MPQVKIEITYNPNEETFVQALTAVLGANNVSHDSPFTTELPQQLNLFDPPAPPVDPPAPPAVPEVQVGPVTLDATKDAPPWSDAPAVPSKTDIRAVATALSKKNKPALKAIFESFGAAKLSDISEEHYDELMRKMVEADA